MKHFLPVDLPLTSPPPYDPEVASLSVTWAWVFVRYRCGCESTLYRESTPGYGFKAGNILNAPCPTHRGLVPGAVREKGATI